MNLRDDHGFSMFELAVVMVVIGILTAISIPAIGSAISGNSRMATRSDLAVAAEQLAMDFAADDMYPASLAAANNGKGVSFSSVDSALTNYTATATSYCLEVTTTHGSTLHVRPAVGGELYAVEDGTC